MLSLVKPHYEAPRELLRGGILPAEALGHVVGQVRTVVTQQGWTIRGQFDCPLPGRGGNREVWLLLCRDAPPGS